METQTKFLYGAAIQGIQSFIFQTNELKDIIGASELVEQICTHLFDEFVGETGDIIVSAAGNIKCIFASEEECRKAVREFPKKVMMAAPGITISEAVVKMTDDMDFGDAVELLEERLRAQRNKPFPSITTGLMCMERSRKTGLPAVESKKGEFIDNGTFKKRENNSQELFESGESTTHRLFQKCFGIEKMPAKSMALYLDKLTSENNWIAIIHADGNGLGEIVSRIGKDMQLLRKFSKALNLATINACQRAFRAVCPDFSPKKDIIPFRPVVLGGDDLTIISRGKEAVNFTKNFIVFFEEETGAMIKALKEEGACFENTFNKLTACAGIAFIKSSYPFYYGYDLAESLCERAKKDAKHNGKNPAPSCLMFHKVQSSFVENFNDIASKELTPCKSHSFEFGPYYIAIEEGRWTINQLLEKTILLEGKEGNVVKSDIRQWMTSLYENPEKAKQLVEQVEIKLKGKKKYLDLYHSAVEGKERNANDFRHAAFDILALHSIKLQIKQK